MSDAVEPVSNQVAAAMGVAPSQNEKSCLKGVLDIALFMKQRRHTPEPWVRAGRLKLPEAALSRAETNLSRRLPSVKPGDRALVKRPIQVFLKTVPV